MPRVGDQPSFHASFQNSFLWRLGDGLSCRHRVAVSERGGLGAERAARTLWIALEERSRGSRRRWNYLRIGDNEEIEARPIELLPNTGRVLA